jgi:hypothetical protein
MDAGNRLTDIEDVYLNALYKPKPVRSLAVKRALLDQVEYVLHRLALPQIQTLQAMVTRFSSALAHPS